MSAPARYGRYFPTGKIGQTMANGKVYIDYKEIDDLRRILSANGKMLSRQRSRLPAMIQRHAATAVKRARHMALVPYDSEVR